MNDRLSRDELFKLVLKSLLAAVLIAVLLIAASRILSLLVLAFGAVVIAVLVRGLSDPIARRTGLSGRWAAILVMLLFAGLIAAFVWLLGNQVSRQFGQVSQILPSGWQSVREQIAQLPGGEQLIQSIRTGTGGNVLSRLGSLVMTVAGAITDLLLILFGAVFLALNPGLYRRGTVALFPKRKRALADDALDDTARALRYWMLGQIASMVAIGVLTSIGLMLIGLPGALALGVLAGLLEIIPYAGPILAAVPALLVGLAHSPEMALMTLAVFLVVQQIEGSLIMPLVQKKAVSLPPALTVFGVVAFGLLFGVTGLIFAAPLLVVAFVLVKRLYVEEALDTPTHIPGAEDRERG